MKTFFTALLRQLRGPRLPGLCLALSILCLAVVKGESFTNSQRKDFWTPDGPVNAMAVQGNTLYVGGQFQSLRRNPQATGVALDFGTLTPDPIFPPVKGVVQSVVGDGEGGFYIGGTFTAIGGVSRTNLAYVDRDGAVTAWNLGANGAVLALALANGTLYVGGEFTMIGAQPSAYLAAVDTVSGLPTTWNPNPDKPVKTLALLGHTLYAAGDFLSANNVSRHFLAAWDVANGTLLPWNPNPQGGGVSALTTHGNAVFVGGNFTSIGGATRYGLASVHGNSGAAFPWNPSGTNSGNSISALASRGTTLYAGGNFSSIGGQTRRGLCAIGMDSEQPLPWNPSVSNAASANFASIVVSGDTVFVAGSFTNVNGLARNGFVALDSLTASVRPMSFGLAFPPTVIGISHQNVYLAGAALNTGVARQNLAAIDLRSGEPTSWNPGCGGSVLALLAVSNRVYVGGAFTNLGGAFRSNLAAVDATSGALDVSWIPNPNSDVLALARSPTGNTNIFVGGKFTFIGGQSRNRIAALNNSGTATTWNPGADAPVYALAAAADGSPVIFAGGSFTNIAGVARSRLAALNEFSGAALSGNRDADGTVRALAASGGGAFAGGDFSSVGGQPHSFVAFVNQSGTSSNWNPVASGSVSSLAISAGLVFAGGSFTNIGGQPRVGLAALDPTNAALNAWNPTAALSVNSLLGASNAICAGGRFESLNDSFTPGLVVFVSDRAPVITLQPVSQRVFSGSLVTLTADAAGDPPLRYQWRWLGVPLAGATNTSLNLPNLQTDTGDYTVEVTNNFGMARSEIANVSLLLPPMVLTQPTNQTVTAGSTFSLSTAAFGNPPPQILWRRNGSPIGPRAGSSLVFSNAQPGDGGRYDALILNAAGSVATTGVIVRVISPFAISLTDFLTNAPLSSAASGIATGNNSTATSEVNEPLHAGALGGKSLWMSWLAPSNGLARFDALGSDFDTLLAAYTTANDGSLVLVVGDDDSGGFQSSSIAFNAVAGQTYRIAVDGLRGSHGNIAVKWNLDALAHIPVITQSPTNVVVPTGSTAVFTVAATDAPELLPLTYQWFHGQQEIIGATSPMLVIANATVSDLGEYAVFVKNKNCQTAQSGWAFLELSSVPSVNRDIKPVALTFRDASSVAGTSWIQTRKLTTEPESGSAGSCDFVSPMFFRRLSLYESAPLPVQGTNLNGSWTTTVPRTASPLPITYCGRAVWMEFAFGIHADMPGVLFIRTDGAAVILSGVKMDSSGTPIPLSPPACATSAAPAYPAMIRMNLEKDSNYVYSIVTPSDSTAPESVITEERIFCSHPGVAGYVNTQPAGAFQPFQYTNNGVILSAQVTAPNALCGQAVFWLKDGVPVPGEFTTALLVTNPIAFAQYSLVVSNCAGAVTNAVATLIQLEVYKGTGGLWRLKSLPIVPDIFRIEAATNLAGPPPIWFPFFTNQPGHQLPANLPSETISNMFFRARPMPLN